MVDLCDALGMILGGGGLIWLGWLMDKRRWLPDLFHATAYFPTCIRIPFLVIGLLAGMIAMATLLRSQWVLTSP
jgi:hypothetical protein